MSIIIKSTITIGKLPRILPKEWKIIGQDLILQIRKDASRGISQHDDGRRFEAYSDKYIKFKSKGKAVGGRAVDTQTHPPNLRYTGDMLNDMKVTKATASSVTITMGEGQRVLKNIKIKDRSIFGVNDKNKERIRNMILKIFRKNIGK